MRLIYMDESGISNPEQEPWLVVVAVAIDADKKLTPVERHLDSLVRRFIPQQHQESFVFHAKELFNGGGEIFKRDDPCWPLSRRLEVADCLAAIPKKFRLPIFWGFADRKKLIAEQPERSQFDNMRLAYCSSFLLCTSQVEMWLRKKTDGENAILVVENNEDIKGALTHLHVTCQSASALKKTYGDDPQGMLSMFPFRRIKQRPLFEPKAPSSILQIADFCAYVFKRKLMDDARYDRFFWPLYEQHAGREIFQFLS